MTSIQSDLSMHLLSFSNLWGVVDSMSPALFGCPVIYFLIECLSNDIKVEDIEEQ